MVTKAGQRSTVIWDLTSMVGMIVWSVILALVVAIWASRHWTLNRAHRELVVLSEASDVGSDPDLPRVSVLIAAKDEEENIETAVRTMLEQDYPDFEVIVINDRSDDRTGEILDGLRAERTDDRLKVVHVKELRDGWFGKNNAMREGMEVASGDWLCFGDADCRQTSRQTLEKAVRFALDKKVDFLSVLPELETQSTWERIIQPVCGAVMVYWFNPMQVNDPARPEAYANGAFMLMTRACYETLGRHEEVRAHVNEDMQLAQLAKKRNQRLHVIQNRGLYRVRMYSGFPQIWRGWSRIFYGCFGSFRRLRLTMIGLLLANVVPYLSLLLALVLGISHGWSGLSLGWQMVSVSAALAVMMQLTVITRYYKISGADPKLAPTFIIGAVICIGMLFNAMLKLGGRTQTTWRGTTYRADRVVGG